MKKFPTKIVLFVALCLTALPVAALRAQELPPPAADKNITEYELSPDDDTHPMMRITPDKSEIVRLDSDAHSIIIGNPAHLNVLLDSARTLVLVPRDPGATRFTVLDKDGKVIMQRHVIIASPKQDYIRIRRSCANAQGNCQTVSVYYCPDMCHPTEIMSSNQGAPQAATPDAASSLTDLSDTVAGKTNADQQSETQPATAQPENSGDEEDSQPVDEAAPVPVNAAPVINNAPVINTAPATAPQ